MKTKKIPLIHRIHAAAFAAVAFSMSSPLQAATFTWDGGGTANSWGTPDNWGPGIVPVFDNTADLVFDNLTRPNNFIGANRIVRSISYGANIDSAFQSNFQDFSGGAARNLTFEADSGNATVSVDAGATGDITLGSAGGTGTFGNPLLASNLDVVHNGTGLLLFNRPFQAAAFGITKTGTGTMQTNNNNLLTGALNLNAGTFIANTSTTTGDDLDNFSAVNLGGGTLQIGANFGVAKTYNLVPLNVNSPSTLEYKNASATTQNAAFTVAACVLNADLTLKNISTDTSLTNAFSLNRPITGSGNITTSTLNNITASGDNFLLGRVQIGGDNSAWGGDLVISKGTLALGGTATATGNADITLGTAADALGAGLTFSIAANVTYNNAIIVTPGGFRAIKGNSSNAFSATFTGPITLNGDLTVDHTWSSNDKRISLNGPISGPGGLTITRTGANTANTAVLSGANTYTGPTLVTTGASLSLARTCSLTSNITVQSGARIGGAGSTTGNLTLDAGANFFFFFSASFAPMNVAGTVTLDNSFNVLSLVGGSQGEAIPWANVAPGTYTLIGGTASNLSNIGNFGAGNAVLDIEGTGKNVYFQGTTGLQLVVTGPSGFDNWKSTNVTTGGLDEDHDNDGVDNGVEYFLSGNLDSTGFTPLPALTANSITWQAASINAGYGGVYDIHFVVETSETLEAGSWVTAPIGTGAGTVSIPFAAASAKRNVTYTFPTTGPKKFARLKVTGP